MVGDNYGSSRQFRSEAEVKLSKCDSIPEIRESITIAELDYSSSCNVLVEKCKDVLVSIQCKHEHLKYLLIKPLKVATIANLESLSEDWTDVDKLNDRNALSTELKYSAGDSQAKSSLGFAQTFYGGLITLLLGDASECSVELSLKGTTYSKALVQVVTAGVVDRTKNDATQQDCSDEETEGSEADEYTVDSKQDSYDPSDD